MRTSLNIFMPRNQGASQGRNVTSYTILTRYKSYVVHLLLADEENKCTYFFSLFAEGETNLTLQMHTYELYKEDK